MALISHVPHSFPVLPLSIISSYLIDDGMGKQRSLGYETLMEGYGIYNEYFETGKHPLITPALIRWAISRTDQTTLQTSRSESREWMERLALEAMMPIEMKALCAYFDKLGPVVEIFKKHPQMRIAFVTNFPHGTQSPEESGATIRQNIKILRDLGLTNPIDVDTVANYGAWMDGDIDLVERTFKAEGEACREMGATWKPIMKVSVHAYASKNKRYGDDFFKSVYDMATLAMKHGGNPKTSTGQAAAPPYNLFVPKDNGHIAAAIPMILAIRDYNAAHGTKFWPKFSGGNESEADVAVLVHAMKKLCPDMLDHMVIGANYRLRQNLLKALEKMGNPIDKPSLKSHAHARDEVPAYVMGLPEP